MLVFKENALQEWRKSRGKSMVREMVKGRPMQMVLDLTAVSLLLLQAFGKRMDRTYFITIVMLQFTFLVLYPILNQPCGNGLSELEPGKTREALEELATIAKFPLKNVYVLQGETQELMVQTTGWPRQRNIIIHSTLIENSSTEDIVALTAQRLGWWKNGMWFAQLIVSQVHISLQLESLKEH